MAQQQQNNLPAVKQAEEDTIDLLALAEFLLKRVHFLVIAMVLCGVIAFVYTIRFVTPLYSAKAMLYVNNSSISVGGASVSISGGDLTASRNLVQTYAVILSSRETLEEIIAEAELPYSYSALNNMLSASAVNNTEVLQIVVTSEDPVEAAKIANTIVDVLPRRISQIIDGTSVARVDGAIPIYKPISPSVTKNTALGALLGLFLCGALLVVRFLMDIEIHTEAYLLSQYPTIPVLSVVPVMGGRKEASGYGRPENNAYDPQNR